VPRSLTADVLQKRTTSTSLKKHTVDYLRNHTKSFEYTREVLINLKGKLEAELARLGGNKALDMIVDVLGIPSS